MPAATVVLILSLLLGLQPLTTDLYLPALPALTASFGAPMAQAQLTLTALLLAFGLSQLVWGPLSDRYGRRPILLVGMSAEGVATVVPSSPESRLSTLPESQAIGLLERQLGALDVTVSDLHEQMRESSELIKALADQNTQLIKRVEVNRRRILWLAGLLVLLGLSVVKLLIG